MSWLRLALPALLAVAVGTVVGELADRAFVTYVILRSSAEVLGDAHVAAGGFSLVYRPMIAGVSSLLSLLAVRIFVAPKGTSPFKGIAVTASLVVAAGVFLTLAYAWLELTQGRYFP